ncbi:alpha/beta hydrolase [Allokutzneria sp. A3M-2-11 16]|uniref:alpha/beta fold hydrolase n=1 Tax=Allokutzneria sp. A3M-2-11 16 TaxID=2962043 RepID=UPI0020B6C983|nr:alpha/beta hydrolase [Allokutzneria sp. A3M-2-11 16]MCP3801589.1 alpha/beta hydrolase [Allokutzneria sp. A3M-2-11 16]
MFEGFALEQIDVGEVRLSVRRGGSGPPILLLHGHPRTHTTWHRVAPLLARRYSVVCPDMRGYGQSSKPQTEPDHSQQSKRAVANDCVKLMEALGHKQFAVVGHDRGGYVAHRLAVDHPDRVTALVALDVVPIGEALARCDARFAASWWHWFFLGQETDLPERVINADPVSWYRARYNDRAEAMGEANFADFQLAINDPETVHAMCEDYRAGLGVDRIADDADRAARRRVRCPALVLWADGDDLPELYGDVVEAWRDWAEDVEGAPITSGHHLAEDAPDELAARIQDFLSR